MQWGIAQSDSLKLSEGGVPKAFGVDTLHF